MNYLYHYSLASDPLYASSTDAIGHYTASYPAESVTAAPTNTTGSDGS